MVFKNKLHCSILFLLIFCSSAVQVRSDPATSQAQAEAIAQRFLLRVAGSAMSVPTASGTDSVRLSTKAV